MSARSTRRRRGRPPYPGDITPAEQRVLDGLRRGLTYREIADELGVSYDTVKYHVSNMLSKAGVERREQLVGWADRRPGLPARVLAIPVGIRVAVAAAALGASAAGVTLLAAAFSASNGDQDQAREDSSPGSTATASQTPELPTPTLGPARESSRSAAIEAISRGGGGAVLQRALARDVDALLDLIKWEERSCDSPEVIGLKCADAQLAPGTAVPVTRFENSTGFVTRDYLGEFLKVLVASPESELVFAARTPDRLGISFAIPEPQARPIGGGSPVQGIWFDVAPGDPGSIERIYFFTQFSGPRQFYQAFYQTVGGEVLYFDEQRAPATDAAPTPDAPRPMRVNPRRVSAAAS